MSPGPLFRPIVANLIKFAHPRTDRVGVFSKQVWFDEVNDRFKDPRREDGHVSFADT